MRNFTELRLKAKAWVEARGYRAPTGSEDYANIARHMAFEVHCAIFVHNPSWLEDLLDAAVGLRKRAEYDHTVTLPTEALPLELKGFFCGKRKRWLSRWCAGAGPQLLNKPNERNWVHVECGVVLPALSGFDDTAEPRASKPRTGTHAPCVNRSGSGMPRRTSRASG